MQSVLICPDILHKQVAAAGVIKAGHTGWNQAEIAAANILASIEGRDMIEYEKSPPQIKVTLGLVRLAIPGPVGFIVLTTFYRGTA